jgi:nucleotide-binding universal stress UspA family protein
MRIDEPLRRILVPTDFSTPARRALDWAVALASLHQARICLVHAVHGHRLGTSPEVERALEEAAARKLQEASRPIVDAHLSMSTECRAGKPWSVICETAQSTRADLIVIGSRGLTGLDRVLLGRTADRVLRRAGPPVLTVHPTDARPSFRHVLIASDFSDSSRTALAAARFRCRACRSCSTWPVPSPRSAWPPSPRRASASGYAAEYGYELGMLDTSLPFAKLRERCLVNAKAERADRADDFSLRIREGIPLPPPYTLQEFEAGR